MSSPLQRTNIVGTITWLGRVLHRDSPEIAGEPLTEMRLGFGGLEGEYHAGLTRPACSRVAQQYPADTEIRNTRQLSLVSAEELAEIAATLGLTSIDPAWLGASVVITGLPDFTHIPPSARLQAEEDGTGGATLTVDMLNKPCQFPARTIEAAHPGKGRAFKTAANGRRGVTAWVERPGTLRLGQSVRLHVPGQRAWRGKV